MSEVENIEQLEPKQPNEGINYYLKSDQFSELQGDLIAKVAETSGQEGIHAAWITQQHPYANLVRTLEAEIFPEMANLMAPFESQSTFLALVDNRPAADRIVHAFRITSLTLAGMEMSEEGDATGVALLDDLVASGQNITAEEIRRHYAERGLDLAKCISVETNFRVGEKVETDTGLAVADIGYLAIFRAMKRLGAEEGSAAVFTHLSHPSFVSMDRVGIQYFPIAGREDLRVPTILESGERAFDDKYTALEIPMNAHNAQLFEDLMPFAAPEVLLSHK